jgi:uncharacterized repeat protein (TIGR02543 family)
VRSDIVVTALYTINNYTVSFDANGVNVTVAPIVRPYGSAIGVLPTPAYAGLSFGGWYDTSSGGTQVTSETVVTGDVTYYAQWGAKNGWFKEGGAWKYYTNNIAFSNGWLNTGGRWFYFTNTVLKTGWFKSGSTWYYLDPSDGHMYEGLHNIGGGLFLLANGSGKMLTGWQSYGGEWYHFQSSGRADAGWFKSGSSWYYLDPASGRMLTDWQRITYNGKADWYYFQGNGSGRMLTGAQTIRGVSYTFSSGGALISPAAPV